jgi:DNA-binding NarL/FixJ family response regulator
MKLSDRSLRGRGEPNRGSKANQRDQGNKPVEPRTRVLVCACGAEDAQLLIIYSDRIKVTYLPTYDFEEVRAEIEGSAHKLILCGVDAFLEAFPSRAPDVTARTGENGFHSKAETGIPPFAGREAKILAMLARGQTNDEIAKSLHLSSRTVKRVLSELFERLQVSNRTELTARVAMISHEENNN